MKRSNISIKWKLFTYFALFTAIILVILWLCQVVFLDSIYKIIKVGEIELSAHTIVKNIDSDSIVDDVYSMCSKGDMCVMVLKMVDENTALLVINEDTLPNCTIHNTNQKAKFQLYDLTVKNGGKTIQRYRYDPKLRIYYSIDDNFLTSSVDDTESIVYTTIAQDAAGNNFLIMLNSAVTPVAATVMTLRYLLGAISIILLLFAMLFAYVFSRKISKPIIKITGSAKLLAKGNYSADFKGNGYREISELSDALNYAAAELSKVDNLRRELIANISHDLRTPLTMIEGYSEVMRDIPNENIPENVQIIIDETKRLTSLVNDMLDISKLESGNSELTLHTVNITDSVNDMLMRYNKMNIHDDYIIRFDYDRSLTIYTDETKVTQALYNLVNNAVTYAGKDKTVIVRQCISDDGMRVRFAVTDNGDGIPPEKLHNIWERYYKVDKVHRRTSVGTGLGLSIVKKIVNLMDGTYGAESTLGSGSTFWFEIPVLNEQQHAT